jgi:hypothetical protein
MSEHEDVIAVSTGRPVKPGVPASAPAPVNTHPGPDFAPREA